MREQADILLIGAGIAGCSIAAHILRLQPEMQVMLLDGAHVGAGSTSRSMAAFRHQWSVPAHVAFSLYSAREYDAMAERGVPIGFRRQGYLFLHDREEIWREAARHAFDQSEAGAGGVRTLSVAELTADVSCGAEIEDDAVVGAIFGARDGWLDPLAAAQAYLDEARAAGLDYRPGTAVTGLHTERGRLSAVACTDGLVVTAGRTVLCAGPWSAPLATMADLDLPIRPAKRYLYQTRPIVGVDVEGWPMIIAPGGAHCRPAEGNTLILGWEDRPVPLDQTPGAESLWEGQDQVDPGFGTDPDGWGMTILARLADYLPVLAETASIAHVTCGWYTVTPDHKALLGPDPRLDDFYHATGFSGHGIMHGPATGLCMAELLLDRAPSLIDGADLTRQFGVAPLLNGIARPPIEEMVL